MTGSWHVVAKLLTVNRISTEYHKNKVLSTIEVYVLIGYLSKSVCMCACVWLWLASPPPTRFPRPPLSGAKMWQLRTPQRGINRTLFLWRDTVFYRSTKWLRYSQTLLDREPGRHPHSTHKASPVPPCGKAPGENSPAEHQKQGRTTQLTDRLNALSCLCVCMSQ